MNLNKTLYEHKQDHLENDLLDALIIVHNIFDYNFNLKRM